MHPHGREPACASPPSGFLTYPGPIQMPTDRPLDTEPLSPLQALRYARSRSASHTEELSLRTLHDRFGKWRVAESISVLLSLVYGPPCKVRYRLAFGRVLRVY